MTCIDRQPECGLLEEVSTPFEEFLAGIGISITVLAGIIGFLKFVLDVKVVGGVVTVGTTALGSSATVALFGGLASGVVAAITMIIFIGLHVADRCIQGEGRDSCAAGLVNGIVESFSSASDELLPFTAMHDRVDLVVKSRYWDLVESNNAFVHCTLGQFPRQSEILRCYYFDPQVCAAAKGSLIGGGLGAAAGVAVGAAAAVAIGCATVILCFLALIVAAIIVIIAALLGAFAGGQIAKAATDPTSPETSSGQTLGGGDLITVRGGIQLRSHDEGANVMWWVLGTDLHGRISDGAPIPWSYCEVDDELPVDGCALPPREEPIEREEPKEPEEPEEGEPIEPPH